MYCNILSKYTKYLTFAILFFAQIPPRVTTSVASLCNCPLSVFYLSDQKHHRPQGRLCWVEEDISDLQSLETKLIQLDRISTEMMNETIIQSD